MNETKAITTSIVISTVEEQSSSASSGEMTVESLLEEIQRLEMEINRLRDKISKLN